MTKREILQRLKGQLIVSCQAYEDNPLYGTENMVTMAKCVLAGGAKGIRAVSYTHLDVYKRQSRICAYIHLRSCWSWQMENILSVLPVKVF